LGARLEPWPQAPKTGVNALMRAAAVPIGIEAWRNLLSLRDEDVYSMLILYTSHRSGVVRTNIEIDDALMAEAQKVSGHATKRQTVEQALRLLIRLQRQQEVDRAFGKYRWRGDLARSRKGRASGDRRR
jgi:Arc/MetJ family transcription regulator